MAPGEQTRFYTVNHTTDLPLPTAMCEHAGCLQVRHSKRHLNRRASFRKGGAHLAGFLGQPSTKVRWSTRQPRACAFCCTWYTCAEQKVLAGTACT